MPERTHIKNDTSWVDNVTGFNLGFLISLQRSMKYLHLYASYFYILQQFQALSDEKRVAEERVHSISSQILSITQEWRGLRDFIPQPPVRERLDALNRELSTCQQSVSNYAGVLHDMRVDIEKRVSQLHEMWREMAGHSVQSPAITDVSDKYRDCRRTRFPF